MLSAVWYQLGLFPHLGTDSILPCRLSGMDDSERDCRTGSQWMRSVKAYLSWRAGESWRRSSGRWAPERWAYLDALRLLNGIGLAFASPTPTSCRADTPAPDSLPSSTALVNELMRLKPELTARRTLLHFKKDKLARMVDETRAAQRLERAS